jgi:branched-chain amino acid transport system permease protein
MSGSNHWIFAWIGLAGLAVLPLLGLGNYIQHLLILWLLFSLMAISLNLVIGYLGELSFGHAAFFGLGAYASAMLTVFLGYSFWAGLLLAPVVSGLFGLVIGYVSLRVKGPQFAILTLGFGAIIYSICINWIDFTNGPLGITRIPRPSVSWAPWLDFREAETYYYLVLVVVALFLYLCSALLRSKTGRAILAIRENDVLAAASGINVFAYKLLAFVLATMLVGFSGSLYAHYMGVITPDLMTLAYMAPMIIMVIVGGKGTVVGPLVGAFVYVALLEVLRASGSMRMLVFAVLLAICVIALPGGVVSLWSRLFGHRTAVNEQR